MKITTHLSIIPILVSDQEVALAFYTEKLGLEKRTDMAFGPRLRLLTVASKGQRRPEIALIRPEDTLYNAQQIESALMQREQQAPWVFDTDDCQKAYALLQSRGIHFISAPTRQCYGTEAKFSDPFGNTFILLEASPGVRTLFKNRRVGRAA